MTIRNPAVFALLAAMLVAAPLRAEEPHAAPAKADAAHAGDAHAADGHSDKSLFSGGIGNVVITAIIFGVVVYVLGTQAWPHVLKALNEREASIRTALENAKRERESAERLLAEYRRQVDQARVEATAIVEEGRRDADAVRRRIQDEARQEAEQTLARAKREIELTKDAAVKELYDRTAELSVKVASQVLQRELKVEDHRALVAESIARMRAGSGTN